MHTRIVATTFWVGEIFDPSAPDGSQVSSTYDGHWLAHYGGCDGVLHGTVCETEPRSARNGWFPTRMTPKENPFYLDVPFDDVNDPTAFAERAQVVPWAHETGFAGHEQDPGFSYLKNRWVRLVKGNRVCYGQNEDAGPGQYHDAGYVFGVGDPRPANARFNGAGMDISPALNACLGFTEMNGADETLDWQFVDDLDVPGGPWQRVVTTRQVTS